MVSNKKILVCGAGGGGSNNLIRSIRKSGINVWIVGTNLSKYYAAKSNADITYVLPPATEEEEYISKLAQVIKDEKVELVIPNSDREVHTISKNRHRIDARIFLPKHSIIEVCQDKFQLYNKMKDNGIPMAETYEVTSYEEIPSIFEKLGNPEKVWCRMKKGSGSKGATSLKNPHQAKFWISYWEEMRGFPHTNFLLSSMLPGRDFAFQSTWKDGEMVLGKICERLEYVGGDNRASGVSSSPQLGKTVYDQRVLDLCQKTVKLLDPNATGNYSFDLKEDASGNINICEINIGRFCMITPIFDLTGKHNMAETYIKIAFDETLDIPEPIDIEEDYYLIRELDTEPLILHAKEVEERIRYV